MFGCFLFIIFVVILAYFAVIYFLRLLKLSDIDKRPVFITGCDSGFGKLLALKLVAEKTLVFAGCLTQNGANELICEAGTKKYYLKTTLLDVTSDDSVKNAVEFVRNGLNGQKLWAVVNNAGILIYEGASEWISIESYKKTFDVNTLGVIRICNAFLPLLRESRGRIVTVSSCSARIAVPPLTTYTVSKYAVEGYLDILRREIRHFGISCHILEPGVYKTPLVMAKKSFLHSRKAFDALPEQIRQVYGEKYLKNADECYYKTLEERANPNVEEVVDAYYHAITARFPKLRYAIGREAMFLLIPSSFLPTPIQDWALRHFNVNPVPNFGEKVLLSN